MNNKNFLGINKTGILASFLLLAGISAVYASSSDRSELTDSLHRETSAKKKAPARHSISKDQLKSREVYTSQQLFVVEISPKRKPSDKRVKFKAELRDAFKIICYDQDTTYTELNWTMCQDNNCPRPGVYDQGTAEYNKLAEIIAKEHHKTAAK